ncbi:hypothetical protein ACFW9F_13040, partial [Streptomyces sp. NPDC059506]|uniref:hypothetical protein n=1 Tax=Streptomyces sp. NPDC059506 TaxID=3347751 RepID=UPI00367BFCF7
ACGGGVSDTTRPRGWWSSSTTGWSGPAHAGWTSSTGRAPRGPASRAPPTAARSPCWRPRTTTGWTRSPRR